MSSLVIVPCISEISVNHSVAQSYRPQYTQRDFCNVLPQDIQRGVICGAKPTFNNSAEALALLPRLLLNQLVSFLLCACVKKSPMFSFAACC